MEKMGGKSMDIVAENVGKLKELFPEAFTEGKVDFEVLKEVLGTFVDDRDERYSFTWNGKSKARMIAQTPSTGTLRPCKEESVDWDTTQNIFIEGDNLEVLKLLQKSYHKKVKMIYIDPPYNTGKDFVYKDNFKDNIKNYKEITGQVDGEGRNLSNNPETSGRYHTDWLNMMYPRLKLARNLLKDDGVIFISIDDNEFNNLKNMCNEIFGEENFLVNFSWRTDGNFDNQAKFKRCHEYILGFAKDEQSFMSPPVIDPNVPKTSKLYKPEVRNTIVKNGPKNPVSSVVLPIGFPADAIKGIIKQRSDSWPHYFCDAKIEDGKLLNEVEVQSGWSSKDLLLNFISNNCESILDNKGQETRFVISETGAIEVIKKRSELQSHVISSLLNLGGPQKASAEIQAIDVKFDDYPKPLSLIKYLCQMVKGENDLFLDFFAGSSTTAHAVMQLNSEDSGSRKLIMVQLPEVCKESTEAFKAGYKTIAEISKERIRRAAAKIKEELTTKDTKNTKEEENLFSEADKENFRAFRGSKLDLGFKVFKLDSTNIKPWEVDFDMTERTLEDFISNIKTDRREDDVLYEILLKYGLNLTLPIDEWIMDNGKLIMKDEHHSQLSTVNSQLVYSIGMGALIICLSDAISLEVVEGIAELKDELNPEIMRVVFKDSGFKDDVVKTNAVQILKQAGIVDVRSL